MIPEQSPVHSGVSSVASHVECSKGLAGLGDAAQLLSAGAWSAEHLGLPSPRLGATHAWELSLTSGKEVGRNTGCTGNSEGVL